MCNHGDLLHHRASRDGDYLKKLYGDVLKEGYFEPTGDPNILSEAREIKWESKGILPLEGSSGDGSANDHWLLGCWGRWLGS